MICKINSTVIKALLFAVAMLLFASCQIVDREVVRLRSYVNYYEDGEFKLYLSNEARMTLWLRDSLTIIYYSPEVHKDKTNAEFLRIAERNGDRSYNKRKPLAAYIGRQASAHNFKSVRVVCLNRAWDPSHPVGASLNDITEIECSSYAKYVHSGYDDAFKSSGRIKKQLSQLNEDELTMIQPYIEFAFKVPDEPGTYRMQVTMVTTEGEERVAECDFIWE